MRPDLFGICLEGAVLVEAGVEVYQDVQGEDSDDWVVDGLKEYLVLVPVVVYC